MAVICAFSAIAVAQLSPEIEAKVHAMLHEQAVNDASGLATAEIEATVHANSTKFAKEHNVDMEAVLKKKHAALTEKVELQLSGFEAQWMKLRDFETYADRHSWEQAMIKQCKDDEPAWENEELWIDKKW